ARPARDDRRLRPRRGPSTRHAIITVVGSVNPRRPMRQTSTPSSTYQDQPAAAGVDKKAVEMISYLQAVVIGLLQGVTELFPVSSLGHSVLVPAFIGGRWDPLVTQSATASSESSPYLAFIVALHVATAAALLIFFRADWVRIIRGFLRTIRPSIAARRIVTHDGDERLAWLLIIATIPVGITGLALEHT